MFVLIVRWALTESPRCFVKEKVKEPEDNKGIDNDYKCDVNVAACSNRRIHRWLKSIAPRNFISKLASLR